MEWRNLKNNFPITGDTVVILVSDGKNVYTAYEDKEQIWFHCDPRENYDAILDRLTHWAYLTDIPLPENHNKDNINELD